MLTCTEHPVIFIVPHSGLHVTPETWNICVSFTSHLFFFIYTDILFILLFL